MMFRIPESLETDRLLLRTFREDDWKDLHDYYSDEICTRYTAGRALDVNETWREVAIRTGHWLLRGYGPYAVEEKASKKVVGIIGLWYPLEWPEPEITWHLSRRYFYKGFAREGTRAVLNMAKEYMPEITFISIIHPENGTSIRLAETLHAQFEKMIHFRKGMWCLYRHQKQ